MCVFKQKASDKMGISDCSSDVGSSDLRVIASGVHFGCVLADAGYGSSAPFRHALSERGLLWAVGLSRRQMVYQTDVAMIFPTEKARKPRKHHIPDMLPVSAEEMLVGETWRK